ncbi:MAG: hypothetical protein Q8P79_03705 [Nanoarchaeota archaeon]|nr:hypothetical protein [Nanoarchaeota archaeon]
MHEKRGQVTIFIIIAILIIGAAVTIYMLVPRAETASVFDANNPAGFIQTCLEDEIEQTVDLVSSQGGSVEPDFSYMYLGDNIEYLCYTTENYATCVVQQPLLKQHIESEIREDISEEVETCFANLQENYRNDGYSVELQTGRTTVELLPKRIVTNFEDYVLTVTKGETARHDSFSVILDNNLYELTSIANSIIEWEASYGDVETTVYMTYYKDLKVEKKNQDDGTTIYILTDRNTEKKFQFASRSVVWPPGYGIDGVAIN